MITGEGFSSNVMTEFHSVKFRRVVPRRGSGPGRKITNSFDKSISRCVPYIGDPVTCDRRYFTNFNFGRCQRVGEGEEVVMVVRDCNQEGARPWRFVNVRS